MSEDRRRERLRFRSWHRGTREMDLLLGSFADAHLHTFNLAQLDIYEKLLEANDPDIYSWITRTRPLPEAWDYDVVRLLLDHQVTEMSKA